MPDDPIFPKGEGTAKDADTKPAPAAAGGEKAPAPATDPRVDQLVAQQAETNAALSQLTQTLQAALQGQAAPPPAPDPTPAPVAGDTLNRIATEPDRVLDEVVERAVKKAAEAGGQADGATMEALHKVVVDAHTAAIKSQFGGEAWDKFFKPELDRNFGQLRQQGNLAALADRDTVKALTDRIVGANLQALNEAAANVAKTAQETADKEKAALLEGLPAPGLVGVQGGDGQPSIVDTDDFKLFAREIEAQTGEKVDPERFKKIHGPKTHKLDDYIAALGDEGKS